jgi:hypothetical protein
MHCPSSPTWMCSKCGAYPGSRCRCTPVEKEPGEACSWLPSEGLTGDEGEAQRGLASEAAAVLSELARSEEEMMHNECLIRSEAGDSLYGPY